MRFTAVLTLALCLCVPIAACGGGGGDSGEPPTITLIAPVVGSILGGTLVTATGTEFTPSTAVTVDGAAATSVTVGSATSLTFLTPAGAAPGAADVTVSTAGGADTLSAAFTYFPPPAVTAIAVDRAGTTGGRLVAVSGTGFTANGAGGTNTVTIGGTLCTGVTEVSDTLIRCTTPSGAAGSADVVVRNANGAGTLVGGFTYVTPTLYAATARSGNASTPGTFYRVAPADASAVLVGATGDVLTGLAFDPTFTTLYGLNTSPFADQSIFTVDPGTGATTLVGPSGDPPTNNCGDLTFVSGNLVGNSWVGEFVSFDTTTGAATLIGTNTANTGLAMAADAQQQLWLAIGNPGSLYSVNPATGDLTLIAALSGDITPGTDYLCALTFLDGTLYGVTTDQATTARLVTVDLVTAVVTEVGVLPVNIDALEGNVR